MSDVHETDEGTTPEGVDPDSLCCEDHLLPDEDWAAIEAEVQAEALPDAEDEDFKLEDNVEEDELGDL